MNQRIIEDGNKRSLQEFAQCAIIYLEQHPECDEVVQQADNITELENDKMSAPHNFYELPEGYEYNFSGSFGQVIGVGRTEIKELHRREVVEKLGPHTAIVTLEELGTNCWLAIRFTGGGRCQRVMDCTYPERKTCKAVQAEIDYLNRYYPARIEELQTQYAESIRRLKA